MNLRRYFIKDLSYVIASRMKNRNNYNTHKTNKKGFGVIISLILIVTVITWMISVFETKIKPMVSMMAQTRAKVIALTAINDGIREEIIKNISYEDLITLKKDENQRITALQTNMVKMNEMQAKTLHVIQDKISNINESELKIPIGSLFDSSFFSGLGPKITIKVMPFGAVEGHFVDEFVSAGINQTKHKINLEFISTIVVIIPLSKIVTQVVSSIPIAETIIVGNVPNTYLNTGDSKESIDTAKGLAENLATN